MQQLFVHNAPKAIVYFDLDKYNLKPESIVTIRNTAAFLLKHPYYKVILSGHTDLRASAEYNLALSKNRVNGVRTQLIRLGIEAARISTGYFGKKIPVVSAVNENHHSKNRRVEFMFTR
jgi:peptidoglycan-associated lipoprotein